jgi:hypothetical protein
MSHQARPYSEPDKSSATLNEYPFSELVFGYTHNKSAKEIMDVILDVKAEEGAGPKDFTAVSRLILELERRQKLFAGKVAAICS